MNGGGDSDSPFVGPDSPLFGLRDAHCPNRSSGGAWEAAAHVLVLLIAPCRPPPQPEQLRTDVEQTTYLHVEHVLQSPPSPCTTC